MHVKGGRTSGSSREPCGDDGRLGPQQRKRARDEAVALGGLRNPRKSVEKRLAALLSGHIVDEILSEVCGSTQDGLDSLGDEAIPVALTAAAKKTQGMLAEWLKVGVKERGVQHEIRAAIAGRSEDPDIDVPVWLSGKTPLGIELPITPRGIFP